MATGITRPIQSNSHLGRKDYSISLLISMDLLTAFKACFGPGVCFCFISKMRDIKILRQGSALSYILLIKWGILLPYKTYHRMAWVANEPADHLVAISWHEQSCQPLNQALEKITQGNAKGEQSPPSLCFTPPLVLPKIQLAFWVARTLFWLVPIFSSSRIPESPHPPWQGWDQNQSINVFWSQPGQSVSHKNFSFMAVQTGWDFETTESFRLLAPFLEGQL